MARVEPLQLPSSARDALEIGRWGHPDATYDPLLLVRCLQRHPRLAQRVRGLGESLYVDELEATSSWSEPTWAALGLDFDDEQRMELLVVCGWYRTISTLCNAMALPVEDWMRAWPTGG